jgi:DNA-binding HxlR family transcriptional regulator
MFLRTIRFYMGGVGESSRHNFVTGVDMRLSECPVRPAIDVVEGKWKPIVVNALKAGRLRFGQLRRHAPEASRKVLTEQLRELEDDQIISRKAFGQRWERVEYELTAYGRTLVPVLTLLAKWGRKHKKLMQRKMERRAA